MRRGPQEPSPPILERYELKFVVPEYMIESISDFVSVYCSLDKYSAKAEDNFYRVNNLYFDSPNYLFLRKRLEGSDNRFNMRIRSYGDDPEIPCFFEVKQKRVNLVRKFRARVHDKNWHQMFEVPGYKLYKEKTPKANSNKNLFFRMACAYNASPKVLTQYQRKAYVSDIDDYGRVTFDTDLRYHVEEGYNIIPDENKMVPLDHESVFEPGCNVILELKCHSTQVPLWMIDLIRGFDLRRRSFSKYVTGVAEVLNLYRYDPSFIQTTLYSVPEES